MYAIPTPFIMMLLMMMINHLAGTIFEIHCNAIGMLSIGKINPESRIVGNNKPPMDIIMAVCCVEVFVEINIPRESVVMIKRVSSSMSSKMLPRIGIAKMETPIASIISAIIIDKKK